MSDTLLLESLIRKRFTPGEDFAVDDPRVRDELGPELAQITPQQIGAIIRALASRGVLEHTGRCRASGKQSRRGSAVRVWRVA